MITIFQGGRGGHTSKIPSPYEKVLPLPTPCFLRCFWKDPLMTHPTSSIFHCYPLPIHHPFPPKNFNHTLRRPPSRKMVGILPYNTHIKTLSNLNTTCNCLVLYVSINPYLFWNQQVFFYIFTFSSLVPLLIICSHSFEITESLQFKKHTILNALAM